MFTVYSVILDFLFATNTDIIHAHFALDSKY